MAQDMITTLPAKDGGEGSIFILPWFYTTVIQGTWTFTISTAYYFNGCFYNSTNAAGDQLDYSIWLTKGAYHCSIAVGLNVSGIGRHEIQLDGVRQGYCECYNQYSFQVGLYNPIQVTTSGLHTLSVVMRSGGFGGAVYYGHMNRIKLTRTQ